MFETLIKECNSEYKNSGNSSKDKEILTALEESGFSNAGKVLLAKLNNYIEINLDKRCDFLRQCARKDAEKYGFVNKGKGGGNVHTRENGNLALYYYIDGGFLGGYFEHTFTWVETPIKNYNRIPPKFCMDAVIKAKALNIFDSFVVCEIKKDSPYADPIVVGIIENNTSRFFIAQWDNDICLDDLI